MPAPINLLQLPGWPDPKPQQPTFAGEFPRTALLDDFNRADGVAGPSWITPGFGAGGTGTVANNRMVWSASGFSAWNNSFLANQESWMEVAALPGAGQDLLLACRRQNVGAVPSLSPDGYQVRLTPSTGLVSIRKTVAASTTVIQSRFIAGLDIKAGDFLGFRCEGSVLSVWWKPLGLGWREVDRLVDASFSNAGFVGVGATDAVGKIESFGGGSLVPADVLIVFPSGVVSDPIMPVMGSLPILRPQPILPPSITGQIFQQALDAVVTITADLQKQTNKILTANVTVTPTLTKLVNKSLTTSSTITATLQKQVNKALTA